MSIEPAAEPGLRREITTWSSFALGYADVGANVYAALGLAMATAEGTFLRFDGTKLALGASRAIISFGGLESIGQAAQETVRRQPSCPAPRGPSS